jgi:hypothetical protein
MEWVAIADELPVLHSRNAIIGGSKCHLWVNHIVFGLQPDVRFQADSDQITDIALSQEDDFAGCSRFKYLFVRARRVGEW